MSIENRKHFLLLHEKNYGGENKVIDPCGLGFDGYSDFSEDEE